MDPAYPSCTLGPRRPSPLLDDGEAHHLERHGGRTPQGSIVPWSKCSDASLPSPPTKDQLHGNLG